jgi:hypothetical protein
LLLREKGKRGEERRLQLRRAQYDEAAAGDLTGGGGRDGEWLEWGIEGRQWVGMEERGRRIVL